MDDARTDVESSPEDAAAVVEDETADPELVPSASPDCDPNTTLPPQLNGFSVEKLHELLQQVERLRSEQELLRQDQERFDLSLFRASRVLNDKHEYYLAKQIHCWFIWKNIF